MLVRVMQCYPTVLQRKLAHAHSFFPARVAGGVAFMLVCTLSNASGLLMQRLAHRKHADRHAAAAAGRSTPVAGADTDAGIPRAEGGTLLDASRPVARYSGVDSDADRLPVLDTDEDTRTFAQRMHDRGFFCASPWWLAGLCFQVVGGLSAVGGIALIGQARCAAFAGEQRMRIDGCNLSSLCHALSAPHSPPHLPNIVTVTFHRNDAHVEPALCDAIPKRGLYVA